MVQGSVGVQQVNEESDGETDRVARLGFGLYDGRYEL
jgi:hypothetical protein